MKPFPFFPTMRRAALSLALLALILLPLQLLPSEPVWLRAGLCLFLCAAYLLGYVLRMEAEQAHQSDHEAALETLRLKHEADFKNYIEFVKASCQPSKN